MDLKFKTYSIKTLFAVLLLFASISANSQDACMGKSKYYYKFVDSLISKDIGLIINETDISSKSLEVEHIRRRKNSVIYEFHNLIDTLIKEDSVNYKLKLKSKPDENDYDYYLEVIEDIKETDKVITVSNNTKDTIELATDDGYLISILEAQDKNQKWKPIEVFLYDWCGTGDSQIDITPKKSVLIPVKTLRGGIKTNFRLLLHGNDTIYKSNSFTGYVSECSFQLSQDIINVYKNDDWEWLYYLDKPRRNLSIEDEIIEMEAEEDDEE